MITISEALPVVQAISEQLQLPMLETLMYIDANSEEFSLAELKAYFKVKAEFQKLFEPA
jgi:hypothetical protein